MFDFSSSTIEVDSNGCWNWLGHKDKKGYGHIQVGRTNERVHRLVYRLLCGPIRENLTLDHLCFNTSCCNPTHLEPVTRSENSRRLMYDRNGNSAKTHCPQGHPYNAENTYVRPGGGTRACRICMRAATQRWKAKK